MLDIHCPNCERRLQLPDGASVASCECPACHEVFTPGSPGRARFQQRTPRIDANSDIDPSEMRIDISTQEADVDVLAERRRYQRELEDTYADELVPDRRWNKCKQSAKAGFVCGIVGAVVLLFIGYPTDFLEIAVAVFLATILGFMVACLSDQAGPDDCVWIQKALLG